ncbi:helix-turn-helix transcriptional regulator [Ferrovibrio sp.]|uniref:helix-turn-helix domain-containing protein n=1 Tax=Ferrovibrio sp. TaxID=1917215 RepID=UPI002622457D|nr:helix-turn-helix transcriptional regulator [Ferrovibrio sp.]
MIADNQAHNQEANELVSRIEQRAIQIFKFTEDPAEKRNSVAGFRKFSGLVDDFHQAAEVAEGRLSVLRTGRRDELRRYVAQMRAKILKMEIDVKQTYLENLIEARSALPFGAREFFASRLKRLEELSALLIDGPEAGGTADNLLDHMRRMLQHLMDQAPQLEVFERDPDWRPPQRSGNAAVRANPGPAASAAPRRAGGQPAKLEIKPIRLTGRDEWGRVFLDRGSFDQMTVACRARGITIDQVASKLGITRVALTLILNGQDPIQRNMLDVLHRVINNYNANTGEMG